MAEGSGGAHDKPRPTEGGKSTPRYWLGDLAKEFGISVINKGGNLFIEKEGLENNQEIIERSDKGGAITHELMQEMVAGKNGEGGGIARMAVLEKIGLGKLLIKPSEKASSEEVLNKRAKTLLSVFDMVENAVQTEEFKGKEVEWMSMIWDLAIKLRGGAEFSKFTENERTTWESADNSHYVVLYQELLEYYGIDAKSMFAENGQMMMKSGKTVEELISELNELLKPPSLHLPWEERYREWKKITEKLNESLPDEEKEENKETTIEVWQRERYEYYKNQLDDGEEPIAFEVWQSYDLERKRSEESILLEAEKMGKGESISMSRLMQQIEMRTLGGVVSACYSYQMENWLQKQKGGNNLMPVTYATVAEGGSEGLVFTNQFEDRYHDQLIRALRASGDFYFWESVGRFKRMLEYAQSGFGENRITKDSWRLLEGSSPPAIQFILLSHKRFGRAFGEALKFPEIIGTRDWRTGRPGMFNRMNSAGILRGPLKNEEMGELKPTALARESARRKMEDKQMPRWIADLAFAHAWFSGEGVDLAQSISKVREAEFIVYGFLGAALEPFYDWVGEKLSELEDEDGKKGWGREAATKILRWLTPTMVPFTTLTQDCWKLMSMSPWARDVWFSTFYGRMPAYEWATKIEKGRIKMAIEALNFSGPVKEVWSRYLEEIKHREQKRWGTYFHLLVGTKFRDMGGDKRGFFRYPFDFENKEHVDEMARLMGTEGKIHDAVKKRLELLGVDGKTIDGWNHDDWVKIIAELNTDNSRRFANNLHKQWFGWGEVIINENNLNKVGARREEYEAWQEELDEEDRLDWLTVEETKSVDGFISEKLELVLRDLDVWGIRADTTDPKILKKLAEHGERLDATLARYFYTLAYNYDDYVGMAAFATTFPELDFADDPKALEKMVTFFQEYSKRTGGLYHVKQFFMTVVLRAFIFKKAAELMSDAKPGLTLKQAIADPDIIRMYKEQF